MFLGPYSISFVRCCDHELTHWSIIQEYLAASACFHEIVNKLYVFCFSAATHERINVTCFEREVPCLYIVWITRTFVGSNSHNNPFCKSDIFFAHHYTIKITCLIRCLCKRILSNMQHLAVRYISDRAAQVEILTQIFLRHRRIGGKNAKTPVFHGWIVVVTGLSWQNSTIADFLMFILILFNFFSAMCNTLVILINATKKFWYVLQNLKRRSK